MEMALPRKKREKRVRKRKIMGVDRFVSSVSILAGERYLAEVVEGEQYRRAIDWLRLTSVTFRQRVEKSSKYQKEGNRSISVFGKPQDK
jgi:hypothetical protein